MQVGVFEAKTRLSELLERVERGEEVVITRRGAPIARLALLASRPRQSDLEKLFAEAAAARKALPPTSWAELKRDRDLGRR
jgi:antitoxin (DNA-binding transcriptional repressor) of toxin-antitoxin stability system